MAMTEGTKRLVVGLSLVAAGAVGTLVFLKLTTRLADDENPIRVRNKTLEFESESPNSEWKPEQGQSTKWRLTKNKHSSNVFEVNAFGSPDCVTPLQGVTVDVTFLLDSGGQTKFTFTTASDGSGSNPKFEPVLDVGNVTVQEDNGGKTKKLRITQNPFSGRISGITVVSQAGASTNCSFVDVPRVLVELCRGTCS